MTPSHEHGDIAMAPGIFEAQGARVDVEFGNLFVPMNRNIEFSPLIQLRFVRFKSTAKHPSAPIVYLAGGPGESGIDSARGPLFSLFMALREVSDVIAFDQRGTGHSQPEDMTCENNHGMPLDMPSDRETYVEYGKRQVEHCLDAMRARNIDMEGFTSEQSADDLDDLRAALGVEKVTLWGISYGTHLALATLRRHPARVHAAVLAGVEGPDHTIKLPSNIEENLEKLEGLMRTVPIYQRIMPDLLTTLDTVLKRLERTPVTVEVMPGVAVALGKWDLQLAIAKRMGSRKAMSALPAMIYAMSKGEFFAPARSTYRLRRPEKIYAMTAAMDCASYATGKRIDRILHEADKTLLGAAIDFPLPWVCDVKGLPRLSDNFRRPLRSDIPALFISGTLDGRTPFANAKEVADGFPRHRHLLIERAAHGDDLFLSSPKIRDTILTFLRGEAISSDRIEGPLWQFDPPYEKSLEREITLQLTEHGYDVARQHYQQIQKAHGEAGIYNIGERTLSRLGRDLRQAGFDQLGRDVLRLDSEVNATGA